MSLNSILSESFYKANHSKEMSTIWYALKCPEGREKYYTEMYLNLTSSDGLYEVICFEYQCMMRYGGSWHLERRKLLPGWIFLSGTKAIESKRDGDIISPVPYETSCLRELCQEEHLIGMSKGVIKDGKPVVTSGPLKGRESLIRRIDRHKRTAEIEIPFVEDDMRVIVGLEIYEKQM